MRWLAWCVCFGGDELMTRIKWRDLVGRRCICPRRNGLHDLKAFNLALLAKQGWCLQTTTNSLAYSLQGSLVIFLFAEMGNYPSYAWRSIMTEQSLVRKGYRWQVGNELSLNILKDKWLHKPSTFTVTSKPVDVPLDATVSLLINPCTSAILSIPLSTWLPANWMVWAYSPKGNFMIKSAYRLAVALGSVGVHTIFIKEESHDHEIV